MAGYKRVSFYELCRLCASNHQKEKTHIFQEEGRKIQLQNKIQTCLSLKVCENDFLPKVVCAKCLRSLEVCFTFRQECISSETMLSSYFKNFRYTDDFKKSGKVYIKDTKPAPPTSPTTQNVEIPSSITCSSNGTPVTALNSSANITQNVVAVKPTTQPMEQVPFYTLQLPTTIVSNPNLKSNSKIEVNDNKISQNPTSQPQVAFNLNTINLAAIKTMQNVPKIANNEVLSNVVVNSNGEVINIGQLVDFDSVMNQANTIKTKVKMKKKNYDLSEDNIIKIDLTESENNTETYDTSQNQIKFDKLPHIKSTPNNKYTYTIKVEEKPQNPSVIFNTISEYNQNGTANFNNFNTNSGVFSQSNVNLVNANTTNSLVTNSNIICNATATNADGSTININVLNQNLQDIPNQGNNFNRSISQSNFTNVISNSSSHILQTAANNSLEKQLTSQSSNMVNSSQITTNETLTTNVQSNSNNNGQNPPTKTHVCDICMKSFKRREHLYQHVKLHTGFRPYICEHCNKAFMRKEHLLRHMTLHSGQKNFTCGICDKSFSRNDNLLKHKKTHEKQNSYTCEICQKQFVMKHYYVAHKMAHGDKCMVGTNVPNVWGLLKT